MENEELKERISQIKNPLTQREELYTILDELGIKYNRVRCAKCLRDYLLIAKETVGMIESAAEESSFNDSVNSNEECTYVYLKSQSFIWRMPNGQRVKIGKNTPKKIIEKFIENHSGYYICK